MDITSIEQASAAAIQQFGADAGEALSAEALESEAAHAEAPQHSEQATEPQEQSLETEQKFRIKWRGEEREVTREELIDLAEKGFDYTQKTQELAAKRRAAEQWEQFEQYLKQDPAFAQHIMRYFANIPPGGQAAMSHGMAGMLAAPSAVQPTEDMVRGFHREFARNPLAALQQAYQLMKAQDPDFQRLRQLEQDYTQFRMTAQQREQLQELRQRLNIDEATAQQVVQFAQEHGIRNLEHAYWAMMGPNVKRQAVKEYVNTKTAAKRPPAVRSGGALPPSSAKAPQTFDEARAAALAFLRQAMTEGG